MQKAVEIEDLLTRHLKGELSAEDEQRLMQIVDSAPSYRTLYEEFTNPDKFDALIKEYFQLAETIEKPQTTKGAGKLVTGQWWRIAAAASIFLFLSIAAFIWFSMEHKQERQVVKTEQQTEKQKDLAPGQNKAVLTLADGKKIVLDSGAMRQLTQGTTTILNKEGHIIYNGDEAGAEILYNTLSTAKGEIYSMVLSDGTKVWLNASSSIRFPVAFTGKDRRVELTGEAYFEVAKNKARPFKVTVEDMEVEVLGTTFNINSYNDEGSIKTTLLEGSVKVRKVNGAASLLKPGQQAQYEEAGPIRIIKDADLDQAIAWKNGYFQFDGADLKEVMRQIARWYDVEVVYEGTIPVSRFGGKIHRNTNASQVLMILKQNKINFRIEGKKIIVTP